MTNPKPVNVPASVRQRLLNLARSSGEDFQALLTRYALERFLYRLGVSRHRDGFVLKGAFLFVAWGEGVSRPTADLDFLASGDPEIRRFEAIIRELSAPKSLDDGLEFHSDTVRGTAIREQALHDGIRIRLQATLGNARIPLQIDIGFGDAVDPGPVEIAYPSSGDYLGVSLEEVSGHVGTRLDGLIGADALDPYDTVIDPGRREVRVYEGDHDLVGTHLVLDCSMIVPIIEVPISGEPVSVIFDTGAKLSYLDRSLIEAFPPAGTREDFFPGLGTFTTDTFETPLTLGPNTVTITTGALTSIPALALTLVGARGILGSALFDHFAVGYSPRRSRMTLAAVDTSRQQVDGIDTTR